MALTYELLLSLSGGRGAVVEQLSADARRILAIDTPLTSFIQKAAGSAQPKHIVLTGSAGHGKTFAALSATEGSNAFSVVTDASALPSEEGPLDGLVERLRSDLRAGKRLLIAINRGQLERLAAARDLGTDPALVSLVDEIRQGRELRVDWNGVARESVATIDMGLFDWTLMLQPLLDRALQVDLSSVEGAPRVAAEQAREALSTTHVRAWLREAITGVQSEGRHLTIRQLWALVGFLITGGIPVNDRDRALTIGDSVGARLFQFAEAPQSLQSVLRTLDPALEPSPRLARSLLVGGLAAELAAHRGIGPLAAGLARGDGLDAVRAAHVHDPQRTPKSASHDAFSRLVRWLQQERGPGWHTQPRDAKDLLSGIYKALGFWSVDRTFPAWQRLCYDSAKAARAGAVAHGQLRLGTLVFGLPRPPAWCVEALGGTFRPPYLWLAARADASKPPIWVRLTPRLLNALYRPDEAGRLEPSEALVLGRWIASLPVQAEDPDEVSVMRVGERAKPLQVARGAEGLTRIEE